MDVVDDDDGVFVFRGRAAKGGHLCTIYLVVNEIEDKWTEELK